MPRTIIYVIIPVFLLTFWACRQDETTELNPAVQQQIALLPADADVLGFADIQSMQKSRFFDFITDSLDRELDNDEDYKALMQELGLDLKKDLYRFYFAANMQEEDSLNVLLVLDGNFQQDKILAKIEEKSRPNEITKTDFGPYTLYSFQKNKAFAFINNKSLVAGSENWVRVYLKKRSGAQPDLSLQIQEQLKTLPFKDQSWLLARVGQWTKKMEQKSDHPRLKGLSSLQNIALSIKADDHLRFFGLGRFDDEEKCELFYDAFKGLLAAAKLTLSEDRTVVDILNSIRVNNDGKQIRMQFDFNREDLQKLLESKHTLATKI